MVISLTQFLKIMNIYRKTLNLLPAAAMVALLICPSGSLIAAEKDGKKLLVYILAGQSNMQGPRGGFHLGLFTQAGVCADS